MMPTLSEDQEAKLPPLSLRPPNYFTNSEVAQRYARVRPFFHQEVVSLICSFTGISRFGRALDVGCGSGQSTVALADVCGHVLGVDPSQGMLSHAPALPNVSYRLGTAEELSAAGQDIDLITVGSALHWFDQHRFFNQCQAVLAPSGVLAVYNDHFTAHLKDVVACKRWMRTRFAKRFPPPRRGMRDMCEQTALECGFQVAHRASFDHVVRFTRPEFISYLLTRSNTLAAILSGRETHDSIVCWLNEQLTPILPDGVVGCFIFKCNLWILRRECDSRLMVNTLS